MDLYNLIAKMVTFVALMLVGYIGAHRGIFDRGFAKGLSTLTVNLLLSCTVLNSVLSDPPELTGVQLWQTLLILTLMFVLALLIGFIAVRAAGLNDENGAVTELLCGVMNSIFIGLPLLESLYGTTAVLYCALSCIPFNLLLYTYGVWRLKKGMGTSSMRLKDALSVPLFATLAALVIFIFEPPVPRMICELIGSVSAATMPMSMIVIGATLGGIPLIDAFKDKRVYYISFIRLIVCPAVTWLLFRLMTNDVILLSTCVLLSACPSAVVISVLALQYDYDASYSSRGVLVTTVLSMITLPLWALLLG